ncbi:hypothetical protein BDR04DRAFT_1007303 [Suillus decipiens]|nr:hypothetical protein BDR04DRAFT_1007303 [Suillus decipiens]
MLSDALHNGGIIVEMETKALATWLNTPSGRSAIESKLDALVLFRHHLYTVVLEYLPINIQI